jgi:putative transposase
LSRFEQGRVAPRCRGCLLADLDVRRSLTESGPVEIRVPRDRNRTFEPQAVPKHQRRLNGFDEKVLALYARGMSTRDIQSHLRGLYGAGVSADLLADITATLARA